MIKNIFIVALFLFLGAVQPAFANDPIYTGTFSNRAVGGYDVTTYYDQGGPLKGADVYEANWRGAEWYFSSAENLEKFEKDPLTYVPQYGGYCAWAAAHGTLAKGDPDIWEIVEGKLYLNYDQSIQEKWSPRKVELIEKADEKYPALVTIE